MTEGPTQSIDHQARMEERLLGEVMLGTASASVAGNNSTGLHEPACRVRDLKRRFRSGLSDFAEAHDQYLDDAFDQ